MPEPFVHQPHDHVAKRKVQGPIRLQHKHVDSLNPVKRWNAWLAMKITKGVSTMWCAYAFAGLAALGFPGLHATAQQWVTYVSQTCIQLIMLSVIMVGQDLLGATSDKRAQQTYEDAEAVLHESQQIQAHLTYQDGHLERLIEHSKQIVDHLEHLHDHEP